MARGLRPLRALPRWACRIQKTQKGGRGVMELKTILAIGLVVFIVGALIFLKIRAKKK